MARQSNCKQPHPAKDPVNDVPIEPTQEQLTQRRRLSMAGDAKLLRGPAAPVERRLCGSPPPKQQPSQRAIEGTCGNAAPTSHLKGCQAPPRVSSAQEKEGMASSSAAARSPVNPDRVTVANVQHHPRRSSPTTHCHRRPRPTEGAVHAELRVLGVELSAILTMSRLHKMWTMRVT